MSINQPNGWNVLDYIDVIISNAQRESEVLLISCTFKPWLKCFMHSVTVVYVIFTDFVLYIIKISANYIFHYLPLKVKNE